MKYEILIVLIRVIFGWIFFYAGITKIFNPNWSAAFYISDAKTFSWFFEFLLKPEILPLVNFINAWGLTLVGVSLLLGLWVRYAAPAAALLMFLYYLPILDFPKVGEYSYIIDEHILYIAVLLLLMKVNAGKFFGLDKILFNRTRSSN